mmetsp:Transcript_9352/g.22947  ORF Transcript_9352/g.22947 Transcript_9352/m.22947 type:complete len:486 (-) Transcript_9352:248-1705(-)
MLLLARRGVPLRLRLSLLPLALLPLVDLRFVVTLDRRLALPRQKLQQPLALVPLLRVVLLHLERVERLLLLLVLLPLQHHLLVRLLRLLMGLGLVEGLRLLLRMLGPQLLLRLQRLLVLLLLLHAVPRRLQRRRHLGVFLRTPPLRVPVRYRREIVHPLVFPGVERISLVHRRERHRARIHPDVLHAAVADLPVRDLHVIDEAGVRVPGVRRHHKREVGVGRRARAREPRVIRTPPPPPHPQLRRVLLPGPRRRRRMQRVRRLLHEPQVLPHCWRRGEGGAPRELALLGAERRGKFALRRGLPPGLEPEVLGARQARVREVERLVRHRRRGEPRWEVLLRAPAAVALGDTDGGERGVEGLPRLDAEQRGEVRVPLAEPRILGVVVGLDGHVREALFQHRLQVLVAVGCELPLAARNRGPAAEDDGAVAVAEDCELDGLFDEAELPLVKGILPRSVPRDTLDLDLCGRHPWPPVRPRGPPAPEFSR